MKLHIENVHVHLGGQQPPAGLIAALALASAAKCSPQVAKEGSTNVPPIGEKWPGLEATYAGISLSKDGSRLVHLILWDEEPGKAMSHAAAAEAAEKINPGMESHLPTRHQGIDLFERLQHLFSSDYWYWLLNKTKSGNAAFIQLFRYGDQSYGNRLSSEGRVRAVSEIPL